MGENKSQKEQRLRKTVAGAAKCITNTVAELWKADKRHAPKIVFCRSDMDAWLMNMSPGFPNKFPIRYYYVHAASAFDDNGALKLGKILDRLVSAYLNNIAPNVAQASHRAALLCLNFDDADYDGNDPLKLELKKQARISMGGLFNRKEKEHANLKHIVLECYHQMVVHYTCLCIRELLGCQQELEKSEGFIIGNLRDSYPTKIEIETSSSKTQDSLIIMLLHGEQYIQNHLPNLVAERIYRENGKKLLPALITNSPEEALNIVGILINAGEADSQHRIQDCYAKMYFEDCRGRI